MLLSFWLLLCPSSTESKEAKAMPGEGVWTCSRFRAGKQVKSGYLGWWNLFRALVDLKEAIEASRKSVNKEVVANILNVNPKVFALHSEEDIVEQFLTQ